MRSTNQYLRPLRWIILGLLSFTLCLTYSGIEKLPILASMPPAVNNRLTDASTLEKKGIALYQNSEYRESIEVWQQAAQAYQVQGDRLSQARVLSNLSLAAQQLGDWQQAQERITASLNLLQNSPELEPSLKYASILAQALNTLGKLQLTLGKTEEALSTWQQADAVYTQIEDKQGRLKTTINRAEALQTLGFYRRASKLMSQIETELKAEPDSRLKAVGLRTFGDLLYLVGDFGRSQQILEQSLVVAQNLGNGDETAAVLLSLANLARAQQEDQAAFALYQQAEMVPVSQNRLVELKLAQLNLYIAQNRPEAAEIWRQVESGLAQLPVSQAAILTRINLANSLIRLKQADELAKVVEPNSPPWTTVAESLAVAVGQAKELGDERVLSYALGSLASVYEQTRQWSISEDVCQEALRLALSNNAPDLAYRWQWQLGKINYAQGEKPAAIASYSEAINTLQLLRQDLVAVSLNLRSSFQESVEPVYREFVSLLLDPDPDGTITQANLVRARDVIESFRVVELDNFLRKACLTAQPVQVEQLDPQAAVIYPIVLRDRLEIIVSLPDSPLRHYVTAVGANELEKTVASLRQTLVIRSRRQFFEPAQQLYDWMIRPIAADLDRSQVKTLVFVLDRFLRNVPMATLYDGEHYLVESYNLALAPSLKLLEPKSLQSTALKTLAAGITEGNQGFAALDYVESELQDIKAETAKSTLLINAEFTKQNLQKQIEYTDFPIVHIATHGQFSSVPEQTFLLTWNGRINVGEMDSILQARRPSGTEAIELLVLSACETAVGDEGAALGLAGTAIQSGARSTVGTLWTVNDQATAFLVGQFYEGLTENLSKAQALRKAQLSLINDPWYEHPFYWAPFVLLGSWI